MLSYRGRITLIKAVLSTMPLHYMQAFKLPVGVIKHIDKMRKNFLWKGNETCKSINYLVNWERVCFLKENGGLGIIDLNRQNDALLTKWLCKIESNRDRLWSRTILSLHGISNPSQLISLQPKASFFVNELAALLDFYINSVRSEGGITRWRWA